MQTRHGRIVRNVGKLNIWICYRNQGAVSRSIPTVRNIEIELLRDELTKSHRRDLSNSRVGVVNSGSSPVNLEWRIGGVLPLQTCRAPRPRHGNHCDWTAPDQDPDHDNAFCPVPVPVH